MLSVKRANNTPEPDTGHSRKWTLEMLYAVEPELETIAKQTAAQKRRRVERGLSNDTLPMLPRKNRPGSWWAGVPVIPG